MKELVLGAGETSNLNWHINRGAYVGLKALFVNISLKVLFPFLIFIHNTYIYKIFFVTKLWRLIR